MGNLDSLSAIDTRYDVPELHAFFTERSLTHYKLRVESAWVEVLAHHNLLPPEIAPAIQSACEAVTGEEVERAEGRLKHDIRALISCIREKLPSRARPWVHFCLTSYDVIDTARALQFKQATQQVAIPMLLKLLLALCDRAEEHVRTPQIGRTHLLHALPITAGFWLAKFIARLTRCIQKIDQSCRELVGKCSGAVGAYNAQKFFFKANPFVLELALMNRLGLKAADFSTQIVPPEPLFELNVQFGIAGAILAELGEDIRYLNATEIREVREQTKVEEGGSSTMVGKDNPIVSENAVSLDKYRCG